MSRTYEWKVYVIGTIITVLILLGLFLLLKPNSEASIPNPETVEKIQWRELEKAYSPTPWLIEGDSVYTNDEHVRINITPHTGVGWITVNLENKHYVGDADMAILINSSDYKITAARYNPQIETFQKNYTCAGDVKYNTTIKHFWCYVNSTGINGTTYPHLALEHDYVGGNIETKTAYWYENRTVWTSIGDDVIIRNINFLNMTKMYALTNIPLNVRNYTMQFFIQPTKMNAESAKYFWGIKPSSETIEEAIINEHFYSIDPWTAGLDVNLTMYYNADDPTANLKDNLGVYNLTGSSNTVNVTGKVGNSTYFSTGTTNQYVGRTDLAPAITGNWTISMWVYRQAGLNDNFCSVFDYGSYTDNTGFGIWANTDGYLDWRIHQDIDHYSDTTYFTTATDTWVHVVVTYNGSYVTMYKDNAFVKAVLKSGAITQSARIRIGNREGANAQWRGRVDEVGVWSRVLSASEISSLYNSGNGITRGSGVADPVIYTVYPVDGQDYNTTITQLNYTVTDGSSCWYSTDVGVSNSSSVSAGTNFTGLTANAGWNNWTVFCNNTDGVIKSNTTDFYINKGVGTILIYPANGFLTTNPNITFSYNATVVNTNLTNSTFYLWNAVSGASMTIVPNTSIQGQTVTQTVISEQYNIPDGYYKWTAKTCGDEVECVYAGNYTFNISTQSPTINVTYPIGALGAILDGETLNLNWTVSKPNVANITAALKNCSYTYNGTTTYLTPAQCVLNTTTFTYAAGKNSLNFTVEDIFNQTATSNTSWIVSLSEISQTYNNFTVEGSSERFDVRVSVDPSYTILAATLTYNGTDYSGTLTYEGSHIYNATKSIIIPQIGNEENVSFQWAFILNDSTVVNSLAHNQTIVNISIDDCTTNTKLLYNFTIYDEKNQNFIVNDSNSNITANLNIQIYNYNGVSSIATYNKSFSGLNPFYICTNNNLSGGGNLTSYGEIEYSAEEYATEFYHLQNESVNINDFPTKISLYLLNNSFNQPFKISYKNENLLPVSDALVIIERKYINENIFRVVEVPITDSFGETIGNLEKNDVIYNFIIKKGGITLATFNNKRVVCQNPTIENCIILLNNFGGAIEVTDFEEENDLAYTISHNRETRVVTVNFTVPSGTVSTYRINVTKQDALGSFACTDSVISSAGVLSCTVPASIGNSTVKAVLYRDDEMVAFGNLPLSQSPSEIYGSVLILLSLFILLTLIGAGISDSPIYTIIFFMLGVILLGVLNLVANNGFIGGASTVLWVIIAIILISTKWRNK